MESLKSLIKSNRIILVLVGIALLLDVFGAFSSIMPNAIFGIPSVLVVIYCIGLSLIIRLLIARRRIHLAITWPIIILLYFGWFIIMAFLTDGEPYNPSLLFILCLFSAFNILRHENTAEMDKPKKKSLFSFKPLSKYTRLFISLTIGWFIWVCNPPISNRVFQ